MEERKKGGGSGQETDTVVLINGVCRVINACLCAHFSPVWARRWVSNSESTGANIRSLVLFAYIFTRMWSFACLKWPTITTCFLCSSLTTRRVFLKRFKFSLFSRLEFVAPFIRDKFCGTDRLISNFFSINSSRKKSWKRYTIFILFIVFLWWFDWGRGKKVI